MNKHKFGSQKPWIKESSLKSARANQIKQFTERDEFFRDIRDSQVYAKNGNQSFGAESNVVTWADIAIKFSQKIINVPEHTHSWDEYKCVKLCDDEDDNVYETETKSVILPSEKYKALFIDFYGAGNANTPIVSLPIDDMRKLGASYCVFDFIKFHGYAISWAYDLNRDRAEKDVTYLHSRYYKNWLHAEPRYITAYRTATGGIDTFVTNDKKFRSYGNWEHVEQLANASMDYFLQMIPLHAKNKNRVKR